MERISCDVLVIGAGSGGLSVAAGASQMGARVVLLERGRMGGDCLNYGCVPSKALIAAANRAHAMRTAAPFGIAPVEPGVDYAAVMAHVTRTISAIAPHDSQERFEGLGVRVIREHGRFTGPREVTTDTHVITARRVVIATGSAPAVPPVAGLDTVPFMTNETLFDLREKPAHLIVLGGGPIGMEMAQAHARLGCRVTVMEGSRALGREDPEAAALVCAAARADGVEIREGAEAKLVSGRAGAIRVETADGQAVEGSHLLVAVGRKANIGDLGLDAAGVATDGGSIRTDDRLRTSNRRVLAVGDAAGGLQFTHLAAYHAGIVIRSMLFGLPAKAATAHIPRVTFTGLELAQVGMTEAAAREAHGDALQVLRKDYAGNDRALATLQTDGFVKVMAVRGRPVGVTIVGAQAGELIGIWALALAKGLKLGDVAGMVAPYPTLSELGKGAAGAYFTPKLFDNPWVKRAVRVVQTMLP